MTDMLATYYRKVSRKDHTEQPGLDNVSESKKIMSQSQAGLTVVCFTCSSKGHASWLSLVVFNPYFFEAEKPSSENLYRCKF